MLKKPASFVLAPLRDFFASRTSLRPRWTTFLNILRADFLQPA